MKKFSGLFVFIINFITIAVIIALSPSTTVPIHYNVNGVADGYSSKWTFLWLQIIPFILSVVIIVLSYLSKSVITNNKNIKYFNRVLFSLEVFFIVFLWFAMMPALNMAKTMSSNLNTFILISLGALLAIWSNIFPKLKPNSFIGIRTASTLKNEKIWRKTHRLAGYLGVISGVLMIVFAVVTFFLSLSTVLSIIIGVSIFIVIGLLIPTFYAYSLSKKSID